MDNILYALQANLQPLNYLGVACASDGWLNWIKQWSVPWKCHVLDLNMRPINQKLTVSPLSQGNALHRLVLKQFKQNIITVNPHPLVVYKSLDVCHCICISLYLTCLRPMLSKILSYICFWYIPLSYLFSKVKRIVMEWNNIEKNKWKWKQYMLNKMTSAWNNCRLTLHWKDLWEPSFWEMPHSMGAWN